MDKEISKGDDILNQAEVLRLISLGETSTVQFKREIKGAHAFSQELVAFSNSDGGVIIVGVDDKNGAVAGLDFSQIRDANAVIANAAANNVKPAVEVTTRVVECDDSRVILIRVPAGVRKPYTDKNGVIWRKNAADKMRVTAQEEIARMFQESRSLFADETIVYGTTINDISKTELSRFLEAKSGVDVELEKLNLESVLTGLGVMSGEALTLSGLLLLGERPGRFRPLFTVQCAAFSGTAISEAAYLDSENDISGSLRVIYEETMAFFSRHILKVPGGEGFNATAVWKIPKTVFEEAVANALVHRNYFINTSIKCFVFDDRFEIISPGHLPNSLTIENIKSGISIPRNPILHSLAQYLLPYKGLGTGISRMFKNYGKIELVDDRDNNRFIVRVFK